MSRGSAGRSLLMLGALVTVTAQLGPPLPVAAAAFQSRRVVAVGDIHGSFDGLTAILRETGLIDEDLRWSGGDTVFVQTGDFTDRGPAVRQCMDLLIRLQEEAPRDGGEVIVLLGNHEVMNLVSAWRDVAPPEYEDFVDDDSGRRQDAAWEAWGKVFTERARVAGSLAPVLNDVLREAWEAQYPLGYSERMEAVGPEGTYGKWLRGLPTAARVGDTLFMHAGVSLQYASLSVDELNEQIWDETRRLDETKAEMVRRGLITSNAKIEEVVATARAGLNRILAQHDTASDEGPAGDERVFADSLEADSDFSSWQLLNGEGYLWFRGLALWTEAQAATVAEILSRQEVSHIVVAHTTQLDGVVKARFVGRVFLIDTGMLTEHYGGRPSALEIVDGTFTAIYVGERQRLLEGSLPGSARPPPPEAALLF